MPKLPASTFSASQKDALLDQVKIIIDAGEITQRTDSTDRQWTRWDSAIDRISIKYGIHLDWKRIGPNKIGKPCGRGWIGQRGACKRGKRRLSPTRSRNGKATKTPPIAVTAQEKNTRPPLESIPVFKGEYSDLNTFKRKDLESGDFIKITFSRPRGSDPPNKLLKTLEIGFSVNNEDNAGTARNAAQVMYAVKSSLKSEISKLPDGALLYNKPNTEDGKGEGRIRVYKKAGFGDPSKDGDMYAVAIKGKLWPLTQAEYKVLRRD